MALVGGLVLGVAANADGSAGGVSASRTSGSESAGTTGKARPGWWHRLRPQLIFTAGRYGGFAIGGALLGTIGSTARLPGPALAVATLVAALVMAVLGVRLTGLSPRVSGWALRLPGGLSGSLGRDRGVLIAGAGTFVLPCGFTQAMQVYAISLGSPLRAATVMLLFAVGTTPGLLGLGAVGTLAGRGSRSGRGRTVIGTGSPTPAGEPPRGVALRAVGVLVLAFAALNAGAGLRALGVELPALPGSSLTTAAEPRTVSPNVRLDGHVQVVGLTQSSDGYSPAETTVWAGIPIKWTIDITSGYACSSFVRIPSLGVSADLPKTGRYVLDVPALKVGSTPFTCVMGMYGGRLRAIPRPTARG
jgi:sulfite exporter TauE/SafE